jgi:ketopantoate hydroxymethyltransferase
MKSYESARQVDAYPHSAKYLRTRRDASFAKGMLEQSVALFLVGESEAARLILRDLVTATVGFEELAVLTNRSVKSLRAMLTSNGKPGMDALSSIIQVLRGSLDVSLEVRVADVVGKAQKAISVSNTMSILASPDYRQCGTAVPDMGRAR